MRYPQVNVTLCDVSALALQCTQLTLDANKIMANVLPSDGLTSVVGKFCFIFTNPPFHSGIDTDYSITQNFIEQLKPIMATNAKLMLVANRFLPYPDLIQRHLGKVKTIAQTSKFNLYQN